MNWAATVMFSITFTLSTYASELKVVEAPEETIDLHLAIPGTARVSKKHFFREGRKVAVIQTRVESLSNLPPRTLRLLQMLIGNDGWVEIDLDGRQNVISYCTSPTSLVLTKDSILVTAPNSGYCETYFFKEEKFLDGKDRDKLYDGMIQAASNPKLR